LYILLFERKNSELILI